MMLHLCKYSSKKVTRLPKFFFFHHFLDALCCRLVELCCSPSVRHIAVSTSSAGFQLITTFLKIQREVPVTLARRSTRIKSSRRPQTRGQFQLSGTILWMHTLEDPSNISQGQNVTKRDLSSKTNTEDDLCHRLVLRSAQTKTWRRKEYGIPTEKT